MEYETLEVNNVVFEIEKGKAERMHREGNLIWVDDHYELAQVSYTRKDVIDLMNCGDCDQ